MAASHPKWAVKILAIEGRNYGARSPIRRFSIPAPFIPAYPPRVSPAPPSPASAPSADQAPGPLFVVGCGRSGTTLLRMMLNMHPELAIPEESHVLYQVARLRSIGRWPKTSSPDFGERFLAHVESSPFMANWELEPGALRKRIESKAARGFGQLLLCMYEEYLAKAGKPRWGDKTPMHVQYMWIIRRFFPTARFVHVLRDPRDVAQSVAAKPWGPRHLNHAGHYWKWLVLSGMISGRMLGPRHYLEIRFEDLVREPESILRKITEFAGLEYTDQLLQYHQSQAASEYAAKGNEGSKRLQQKLDPERIFLWRHKMSAKEVKSIDHQCGAVMRLAGYECESLTPRQGRDLERLKALTTAEQLSALDQSAGLHPGDPQHSFLGMQWERARQAQAFACGDWSAWARAGIRWQRGVGGWLAGE